MRSLSKRLALPAALAIGAIVLPAGSALAAGTCPGQQVEVWLAPESADPRVIYDRNGDGIICYSSNKENAKHPRPPYSDNRI